MIVDFFPIGLIIAIIVLASVGFVLYEIFRDRKCKKCGRKMKRHYKDSVVIPDYFYCEVCNTKEYPTVEIDQSIG